MWGALSAALAVLAVGSLAEAQWAPNARPLYGRVNLRAGFVPDPQILSGQVGGPVQASSINSSCRGYITPVPSHVISSRTGFRQLRFVVSAQSDSTLMVMLPNGQVLCDDDSGEGLNPLVAVSAPPGEIRVWVGSYSQSSSGSPYQMGVTELAHITANNLGGGGPVAVPPRPPVGGSPVSPNLPPLFGSTNLRAGFVPDPTIVSGMAGGPITASVLQSGCRGYISPQPSHVLMSQTGFRNIRIVVNSGTDTTLTVMLPNGQILCNDDGGGGLNPMVESGSPPGPIRVWVGTYSSSARQAPYNLGFTELSHVTSANIPQPGGGGGVVVQRPPPPPPPPPPPADLVTMMADIPVTLMGPGMAGNTVAVWNPSGGPPTQIRLNGRSLVAGSVSIGDIPLSMRDPVITVTERRNGTLLVRAEQPPMGRGDRGQQILYLVRWQGRPAVAERWSGTAVQRGPRWSR